MNHHEIRLELLRLAFDISRESYFAGVQDLEAGMPDTNYTRAEIAPTTEEIIDTAELLAEFVFGDDVEFDVESPEDPFEDPQAVS
jgi:hypothetical protein